MMTIFKLCFKQVFYCSIVLIAYALYDWVSVSNNYLDDTNIKNPIIVWWTSSFPGTSETRTCNNFHCEIVHDNKASADIKVDAYLFYGSSINFNDIPLPRQPNEIIWGLYHEESPRSVAELMHESSLKLFNFSSTFSRYSDVPFPLQYLDSYTDVTSTEYFVGTSLKNSYLDKLAPVLFLQSDCETATERDYYVKELMKYIKVDSYGACLNNKDLPEKFQKDYLNNLNNGDFLHFVAKYKFVISIENGICEDYLTEKLWRAIKVGSVPIYFGSPSIRDWLPNEKSAILLEDFKTPKLLANHIEVLMNNDVLYDEYLEHKIKKVVSNKRLSEEIEIRPYQTDYLKSLEEFECFICQKLHDTNSRVSVVPKAHYDCPKPISALTLNVNPSNDWIYSWEMGKINAENLYYSIMPS